MFESRFDADGSWQRPPATPEMDFEADETRRAIVDCLGVAPEKQRAAFRLRDVAGMDTAEICKILDVSRTNLGVLLHRVRNRLRECLEVIPLGRRLLMRWHLFVCGDCARYARQIDAIRRVARDPDVGLGPEPGPDELASLEARILDELSE